MMDVLKQYNGSIPQVVDYMKAGHQVTVNVGQFGTDNRAFFKMLGYYPPSDYAAYNLHEVRLWSSKGYMWAGNQWNAPRWVPYRSEPPYFDALLDRPNTLVEAISAMKVRKLFSDLQVFDCGVFLAELPDAVSHVTKTATVLVEAFLALKGGKVGKAFDLLEIKKSQRVFVEVLKDNVTIRKALTARQHRKIIADQIYDRKSWLAAKVKSRELSKLEAKNDYFAFVSARWLELNYGWYPLIRDTDSLVKLAVLGTTPTFPDVSQRISTSRPITVKTQGKNSHAVLTDSTLRISYKFNLRLTSDIQYGKYIFGISDIWPGAWEAIPFSFVIDWFYNIGNYIDQISIPTGFSIIGTERTEKTIIKAKVTGLSIPGFSEPSQKYLGNTLTHTYEQFNRQIVNKIPTLTFPGVIALGGIDNWLHNKDNMLTSVALLKSIFLTNK